MALNAATAARRSSSHQDLPKHTPSSKAPAVQLIDAGRAHLSDPQVLIFDGTVGIGHPDIPERHPHLGSPCHDCSGPHHEPPVIRRGGQERTGASGPRHPQARVNTSLLTQRGRSAALSISFAYPVRQIRNPPDLSRPRSDCKATPGADPGRRQAINSVIQKGRTTRRIATARSSSQVGALDRRAARAAGAIDPRPTNSAPKAAPSHNRLLCGRANKRQSPAAR